MLQQGQILNIYESDLTLRAALDAVTPASVRTKPAGLPPFVRVARRAPLGTMGFMGTQRDGTFFGSPDW